jgi:hypothetical protein
MKKSKQGKPQKFKMVCLDIETHPFSDEFPSAYSRAERMKFAPEPRIVCVFMESSKRYEFFEPNVESMGRLTAILNDSVEAISYNGEQFDFLVLGVGDTTRVTHDRRRSQEVRDER